MRPCVSENERVRDNADGADDGSVRKWCDIRAAVPSSRERRGMMNINKCLFAHECVTALVNVSLTIRRP